METMFITAVVMLTVFVTAYLFKFNYRYKDDLRMIRDEQLENNSELWHLKDKVKSLEKRISSNAKSKK